MSRTNVQKMHRVFVVFIWGSTWERLSRANLFRKVCDGGLGLSHLFIRQIVSRFFFLRDQSDSFFPHSHTSATCESAPWIYCGYKWYKMSPCDWLLSWSCCFFPHVACKVFNGLPMFCHEEETVRGLNCKSTADTIVQVCLLWWPRKGRFKTG